MSSPDRSVLPVAALIASALLAAAAAGCTLTAGSAAPETPASVADRLVGREWVVEDIDRRGIVDRSRATLVFEPAGQAGGRASCNAWTGRWTLDGERLALSGIAVTSRACVEALSLQEARFLATLQRVRRIDFVGPDGALRLSADGGGSILARRE